MHLFTGSCAGFVGETTGETITASKTLLYVNLLELKAAFSGLKSFCNDLENTRIKVLIDNTTAAYTSNNMGSRKSVSCDLGMCFTTKHIVSSSMHPDFKSRKIELGIEWNVNLLLKQIITKKNIIFWEI